MQHKLMANRVAVLSKQLIKEPKTNDNTKTDTLVAHEEGTEKNGARDWLSFWVEVH